MLLHHSRPRVGVSLVQDIVWEMLPVSRKYEGEYYVGTYKYNFSTTFEKVVVHISTDALFFWIHFEH